MTTAAEMQALLRFLSQDAKVPLSSAMGKIKDLQKASLTSPALIAKSNLGAIQSIFAEEKIAKQVLGAAKRVAKKRSSGETQPESPSKRKKLHSAEELITPAAIEESLALPSIVATDEELANTILYTNRAPLTLAFAVTLLKYTMPEQPLSSRLSLAQAVVSANSHSKAVSLGIEKGNSAEEEAWGQGQPKVRVMGREIRVMRRWDYEWREEDHKKEEAKTVQSERGPPGSESLESLGIQENSGAKEPNASDHGPPLWGLNLDIPRSSNSASISKPHNPKSSASFPIELIHPPQSA
ncbi:hypothetical protein MMC29_005370, partial [Sticta canariensis]|nr:hypothetical protein [Sticta canariensis]